jgi:hypothetical protein
MPRAPYAETGSRDGREGRCPKFQQIVLDEHLGGVCEVAVPPISKHTLELAPLLGRELVLLGLVLGEDGGMGGFRGGATLLLGGLVPRSISGKVGA